MSESVKRTERRSFWAGHVEACAASGQSVLAYARERELNADSLYRWRRKLGRESRASAGTGRWARVTTTNATLRTPALYRVVLPNGAAVELGGSVDAAELDVVLGAVVRL